MATSEASPTHDHSDATEEQAEEPVVDESWVGLGEAPSPTGSQDQSQKEDDAYVQSDSDIEDKPGSKAAHLSSRRRRNRRRANDDDTENGESVREDVEESTESSSEAPRPWDGESDGNSEVVTEIANPNGCM